MTESKNILVVSPHPDDESIGCGGFLHLRAQAGATVNVIFLTSGEKGGHGTPPHATGPRREQEARDAAAILGLHHLEFWREPDGALTVTQKLVNQLKARILEFKPDVLLVPHDGDMHRDHQAAARLSQQAVAELSEAPDALDLPEVWMFEIWTPFQRLHWVIDITDSLETKLAAVRAHQSQCEVMRFDDACRGLARYRGIMHCWPTGEYAEAYVRWRPAPCTSERSMSESAAGGKQ